METFNATARREGKWWVIEIPELGQTTQARTFAEIKVMATDLAAVMRDVDPSEVEVSVRVDTPELPEATWREAREKTQQAQQLTREAAAASREVVNSLRASGYTMRDIAAILGMSHQRVSQLTAES
ncbi:antitoxin HicB [Vibrio cholerae]|nr:antitoxin HicB [Vibrio cholerae]